MLKKNKKKTTPKTNHTLKLTITKSEISIGEEKSFYNYQLCCISVAHSRCVVLLTPDKK